MDRQSTFRWTPALVASAGLLVGCGQSPSPARLATPPRLAAAASTASSIEPRSLAIDESARPLQEHTALAAGDLSWPATLTAGQSGPLSPTVEMGVPSAPRPPVKAPPAVRRSEVEGPLLFKPGSTAAVEPLRMPPSASAGQKQPSATSGPALPGSQPVISTAQRHAPMVRPPTPAPSPAENAELALINQKAIERVREGFQLAERGATFSARSKFNEALWMVAEALDAQQGGDFHTRSLSAGLTANREASDFAIHQHRSEEGVDIAHVVSGHRTPVLKEGRVAGVNALRAQQLYFTYAQEQLAIAAGRQNAASQALYGIGRLAAVAASSAGTDRQLGDVGVAVTCFQAALMTDGRNFRAANELGVLLVNHGRTSAAIEALEHCVRISPQPVAWRNLAAAYTQQGRKDLAERALAHANAGPKTSNAPVNVQWLDPTSFAQTVTQDSLSAPVAKAAAPPAVASPGRAGATAQRSGGKSGVAR